MRQILVAGLLIISLVAIAPPSFARTRVHAPAVTADSAQDRYCISGESRGYSCEFSTYEQCRATASGTNGGCSENPRYLSAEQPRGGPPR